MDYSVPEAADLFEVQSLNLATLQLARSREHGAPLRQALPLSLQPLVVALTDLQIQRLATAPFLILSLRERDDAYWQRMFAEDSNQDLFAQQHPSSDETARIVSAAAGFLWHLVRRNPYAVRLICTASFDWCERLMACPLFELMRRTANRDDLLDLRFADDEQFWRRLLSAGLSSDIAIRSAAHLCALQSALTDCTLPEPGRVPAAACRTAVPSLSVADSGRPP